ncbi:MAG: non-homologous end-joining DNA ligase [Chloroflexota bacterium]
MSPAPGDLFVAPMLATLVRDPFDDPDWLFEIKWDGFRVEACVSGGEVALFTRGGQDAKRYFGDILSPADWLAADEAVIDGELVALDELGGSDFALLQRGMRGRSAVGGSTGLTYQAFDLLRLDGVSLLERPLEERKKKLEAVLRPDPRVRYSEHVERDGVAFFEAARARHLEGIIAKQRASPYLPGVRSPSWLKVKNRPEQELVVVGWTTGTGYATELAALLVAVNVDGRLTYAGKVGAGFDQAGRRELVKRLGPLETAEPPLHDAPTGRLRRDATWVRPELVIRADFAGWTRDGKVRQASFKGIEIEKDPRDVGREAPA